MDIVNSKWVTYYFHKAISREQSQRNSKGGHIFHFNKSGAILTHEYLCNMAYCQALPMSSQYKHVQIFIYSQLWNLIDTYDKVLALRS